MKALILKQYGEPDQVTFADLPKPKLQANDLLVQVHAVGLNPVDNGIRAGKFKQILKFQLPMVMGSDVAGVVVEVGSAVTRFKVGDEFFASVFGLNTGTLAEYACVPEHTAALKPTNLDFVQAASTPMVGLTVWQALKVRANIQPGQRVFIPAGSGGIGSFAIQFAKYLGAFVGTTTSTGNVAMVRGLGADDVVDYKKEQFEKVLRGYDAYLATVQGEKFEQSLDILNPNSHAISLVGPPDAAFARSKGMNAIMQFILGLLSRSVMNRAKKRGVAYSFLFVQPDGSQLAKIGDLLQAGHVRPVIDKVFSFDQAKDALAYLETGRAKGKVVVHVTSG